MAAAVKADEGGQGALLLGVPSHRNRGAHRAGVRTVDLAAAAHTNLCKVNHAQYATRRGNLRAAAVGVLGRDANEC